MMRERVSARFGGVVDMNCSNLVFVSLELGMLDESMSP
jgi:hypothetical protein